MSEFHPQLLPLQTLHPGIQRLIGIQRPLLGVQAPLGVFRYRPLANFSRSALFGTEDGMVNPQHSEEIGEGSTLMSPERNFEGTVMDLAAEESPILGNFEQENAHELKEMSYPLSSPILGDLRGETQAIQTQSDLDIPSSIIKEDDQGDSSFPSQETVRLNRPNLVQLQPLLPTQIQHVEEAFPDDPVMPPKSRTTPRSKQKTTQSKPKKTSKTAAKKPGKVTSTIADPNQIVPLSLQPSELASESSIVAIQEPILVNPDTAKIDQQVEPASLEVQHAPIVDRATPDLDEPSALIEQSANSFDATTNDATTDEVLQSPNRSETTHIQASERSFEKSRSSHLPAQEGDSGLIEQSPRVVEYNVEHPLQSVSNGLPTVSPEFHSGAEQQRSEEPSYTSQATPENILLQENLNQSEVPTLVKDIPIVDRTPSHQSKLAIEQSIEQSEAPFVSDDFRTTSITDLKLTSDNQPLEHQSTAPSAESEPLEPFQPVEEFDQAPTLLPELIVTSEIIEKQPPEHHSSNHTPNSEALNLSGVNPSDSHLLREIQCSPNLESNFELVQFDSEMVEPSIVESQPLITGESEALTQLSQTVFDNQTDPETHSDSNSSTQQQATTVQNDVSSTEVSYFNESGSSPESFIPERFRGLKPLQTKREDLSDFDQDDIRTNSVEPSNDDRTDIAAEVDRTPLGFAIGGEVKASTRPIQHPIAPSDRVSAMLTPGEFVINASATQKHLDLLQHINAGGSVEQSETTAEPISSSHSLIQRQISSTLLPKTVKALSSNLETPISASSQPSYTQPAFIFRKAHPVPALTPPDQWSSVEDLLFQNGSSNPDHSSMPLPPNNAQPALKAVPTHVPRNSSEHLQGFAKGGIVPEPLSTDRFGETIQAFDSFETEMLDSGDLEALAREIYQHLQQRLELERERQGHHAGRLPW